MNLFFLLSLISVSMAIDKDLRKSASQKLLRKKKFYQAQKNLCFFYKKRTVGIRQHYYGNICSMFRFRSRKENFDEDLPLMPPNTYNMLQYVFNISYICKIYYINIRYKYLLVAIADNH